MFKALLFSLNPDDFVRKSFVRFVPMPNMANIIEANVRQSGVAFIGSTPTSHAYIVTLLL